MNCSVRRRPTPARPACREELFECDYAAVNWNAARNRCAPEDLYYPHPWVQDLVWWVLYKAERVLLGSALRRAALREVMTLVHYEDENTRYIDIGPVNKALNLVCCWFEDPEGEPFKRCGAGGAAARPPAPCNSFPCGAGPAASRGRGEWVGVVWESGDAGGGCKVCVCARGVPKRPCAELPDTELLSHVMQAATQDSAAGGQDSGVYMVGCAALHRHCVADQGEAAVAVQAPRAGGGLPLGGGGRPQDAGLQRLAAVGHGVRGAGIRRHGAAQRHHLRGSLPRPYLHKEHPGALRLVCLPAPLPTRLALVPPPAVDVSRIGHSQWDDGPERSG